MKILLGKRRKFYETNLRQKISKPKELCLPPSLIFLPNLKLRPTLTIMQCQNLLTLHYCHSRTQLLEAYPEKISILKGLYPSKAAGIDNLSDNFGKSGTDVLARPIFQLCNLSNKLNSFPRS